MIQRAFQHRSGRVIALGRLVLASVFLLATWVDPSQPTLRPEVAYGLLGGYVLWSAALSLLTWRNWWLDFRVAAAAHLVDIAAFAILVFFTEGYTSPFYTFSMFLLLSSAIRWSWRETAFTAFAVLALFLIAGSASLAIGAGEFDLQRLLIRSTHLVVLSLLFIWFGINQSNLPAGAGAGAGALEPSPDVDGPPVEAALRHAAERLGAHRIVFAWCHKEEPWLDVAELHSGHFRSERFGPDAYGPLLADSAAELPFLFHRASGRALRRSRRAPHRRRGFRQVFDPLLAERFRLDEGIVIRMRARDYEGELFALGVDGLCIDDLREAESLGSDIAALFDRSSMVAVSEEAAVARARASLARDLHDSVVQALAGASFRLEALKSWIRAGKDAAPEIDAVKAELTVEQGNVRAFIAGLRGGRGATRQTDLDVELGQVADQVERRWNLTCSVESGETPIEAPSWMTHEVSQIVREAAANAARHGGATALAVALRRAGSELDLSIADNGRGFPTEAHDGGEAPPASPWTVHERVRALGGTLTLFSGVEGSRLNIRLPLENVG